ncbi:MAG: hypothetical protein GY781_07925 [Gammaproteobacteria bacterium]|nr:hypothetical protein [Gammaproteobacteria bacterium]
MFHHVVTPSKHPIDPIDTPASSPAGFQVTPAKHNVTIRHAQLTPNKASEPINMVYTPPG